MSKRERAFKNSGGIPDHTTTSSTRTGEWHYRYRGGGTLQFGHNPSKVKLANLDSSIWDKFKTTVEEAWEKAVIDPSSLSEDEKTLLVEEYEYRRQNPYGLGQQPIVIVPANHNFYEDVYLKMFMGEVFEIVTFEGEQALISSLGGTGELDPVKVRQAWLDAAVKHDWNVRELTTETGAAIYSEAGGTDMSSTISPENAQLLYDSQENVSTRLNLQEKLVAGLASGRRAQTDMEGYISNHPELIDMFVIAQVLDEDGGLGKQLTGYNLDDTPTAAEIENAGVPINELLGKALGNSKGATPDPNIPNLSQQEIEKKSELVEQCALLAYLDEFAAWSEHRRFHEAVAYKIVPWGGRIIPIRGNPPENLFNNLTLPQSLNNELFMQDMNTVKDTNGVAEWKLTRVIEDPGDPRKIMELDLNFNTGKALNPLNLSSTTAKVDDISVVFDGTNPATARRDVKVTIKMFFTNVSDIQREYSTGQVDSAGKQLTYTIADLILFPRFADEGKAYGRIFKSQYHPDYNRVKLYFKNKVNDALLTDSNQARKNNSLPEIDVKAQVSFAENTTMILNLAFVDHDLVREATIGHWSLTLTYRGFMETILAGPYTDALAEPSVIKNRQDREVLLKKAIEKDCPKSEVQKILRSFEKILRKEKETSLQSIVKRLYKRKRLLKVNMYTTVIKEIFTDGFIDKQEAAQLFPANTLIVASGDVSKDIDTTGGTDDPATESAGAGEDSIVTPGLSVNASKDGGPDVQPIYYFYLGDLLDVISDCIFEVNNTTHFDYLSSDPFKARVGGAVDAYRKEYKTYNFKFLLTTFRYEYEPDKYKDINIADVPIALDWFTGWYKAEILDKDVSFYPAGTFVRKICEQVVTNLLGEVCFNERGENQLYFRTAHLSGKLINGIDPMFSKYAQYVVPSPSSDPYAHRTQALQIKSMIIGRGVEPFLQRDFVSTVNDYANYCIIYPAFHNAYDPVNDGSLKHHDTSGIPHIMPQLSVGPTQKITFKKTNTNMRESRYFNSAMNNLTQLANVYDVTLDMLGNTVLFPGHLIWIELENLPSPADSNGLAFALGLGGYHIVTKVTHKIDVDNGAVYTTTVDSKWVHSGSPAEPYRITKKADGSPKISAADAKLTEACKALVIGAERLEGLYQTEEYPMADVNNIVNIAVQQFGITTNQESVTDSEDKIAAASAEVEMETLDIGIAGAGYTDVENLEELDAEVAAQFREFAENMNPGDEDDWTDPTTGVNYELLMDSDRTIYFTDVNTGEITGYITPEGLWVDTVGSSEE